MAVQIILKNSSVEDKRPTANQLANGEVSLNYNDAGAFLCCRDTDGNIQQIGGIKISDDAPGSPVRGTLWYQQITGTLFVHNGTSWLSVAGGGGGGGGGGDVSQIIGADGIDVAPAAGTGVVTLNADIDIERGLEFVAGSIAVNLGAGLEFNTTTGAIDNTATALQYQGTIDLTSDVVPADPNLGDTFANTGDGVFSDEWVTATGEADGTDADPGDLVVWNGTVFTFIPTGSPGGGGAGDLGYTPTTGTTTSRGGTVTNTAGNDADIPMAGNTDPNVLGGEAQAGLMSPTDKELIDSLPIDANGNFEQAQSDWDEDDVDSPAHILNRPTIDVDVDGNITNVSVDLAYEPGDAIADGGTITNTAGDDAEIPFATAANAGLFVEAGTPPTGTAQYVRQVADDGTATWEELPEQIQSDWTEEDEDAPSFIQNKPNPGEVPSGGVDDRPQNPGVGDLFFDTDLDLLLYWDGNHWVEVIDSSGGLAIVSEDAPVVEDEGSLWYRPSTDVLSVWVIGALTGVATTLSVRNGGSGYTVGFTDAETTAATGNGTGLTVDGDAGVGGNFANPTVNEGGHGYAVGDVVFISGAGQGNGSVNVTNVNEVAVGAWEPVGGNTGGAFLPLAGGNMTGAVTQTERDISGGFDLSTSNFWNCDVTDIPATTNGVNGQSGLIRITTVPTSWNVQFSGVPQTIQAGDIIPFYVLSETSIALGTANFTGTGGNSFYAGASAWGDVAADGTLNGGLNCTVQRDGPGSYTVTFDNPMPNDSYSLTFGSYSFNVTVDSKTADGFSYLTYQETPLNGQQDFRTSFAVHSSNALPPRGGTGADAWGVFRASTLQNSFNIASITGAGTNGQYDVAFTNAMPDADYAVISTVFDNNADSRISQIINKTNTGFRLAIRDGSNTGIDASFSFVVHATNAQLPDTVTQEQLDAVLDNWTRTGTTLSPTNDGDSARVGGLLIAGDRVVANQDGRKSGATSTFLSYAGDGTTPTIDFTAEGSATFARYVFSGNISAGGGGGNYMGFGEVACYAPISDNFVFRGWNASGASEINTSWIKGDGTASFTNIRAALNPEEQTTYGLQELDVKEKILNFITRIEQLEARVAELEGGN